MQGTWIQSLVRELRSHVLHGVVKINKVHPVPFTDSFRDTAGHSSDCCDLGRQLKNSINHEGEQKHAGFVLRGTLATGDGVVFPNAVVCTLRKIRFGLTSSSHSDLGPTVKLLFHVHAL